MVRSSKEATQTGLATDGAGPVSARERFLQGERLEKGVRPSILNSWQRCRTLGLSPDQSELPFRDDFDPDARLVRAAGPVLDRLESRFAGSKMNISVADASGTVLLRRFGEASLARSLPAIQRVPGFVFAESVAGTNGIGLALAERQLIQVYGAEHFAERSQASACRAIPVRDPLSGRIEGVLCLGYPRSAEDPVLATVIRRAADAIERRLLEQSSARERALLRTYLETAADAGVAFGTDTAVGTGLDPATGLDLTAGLDLATGIGIGIGPATATATAAATGMLTGTGAGTGTGTGTGVGPGTGTGTLPDRTTAVDQLARSLNRRDQALLMDKAAELISTAQRAAIEVSLSDGRRITLVSRPMTSASGVTGVAIEVLLPGGAPRAPRAIPRQIEQVVPAHADGTSGERPGRTTATRPGPTFSAHPERASAPSSGPPPYAPPSGALPTVPPSVPASGAPPAAPPPGIPSGAPSSSPSHAPSGAQPPARGLVLLGEPEVGKFALAARRRLELLSEASARIGTTLDVPRTALELAETAVPRLADFVTIDLPEAVLRGDESADPRSELRRTVVHGIRDDLPFSPVGKRIDFRPTTPQLRCLAHGQAVLEPDLKDAAGWLDQDPEHTERLLSHVHSLVAVPLVARGVVLGVASFYRSQDQAPFTDDDRSLAQELAARAALSMDNARRYTRERTMVLALQRSLLPHGVPEQNAVEVAHRYLPAEHGVGGDWYDVIPLSGTRIGLFVGDVVGHGLHSAATMGRLRTAARNFAELDFPPDEVLTHLDNLVVRLDREEGQDREGGRNPAEADAGIIGATCLYAVYDPTSQQCTMARAGHPPPALVRPDGTVTFPDLPAGPPLGLGGLPFETAEIHIPENSQLVLYTDGLIEDRQRDIDVALEHLRGTLAHSDRTPEETCQAVLDTVAPSHPCDDIALLVARTHALDPRRIAIWDLPADPARVSEVRAAAARQLTEWGLEETVFAAELLLSELVTNAIRHGAGPIRVRLLHDRTLIFEVSDTSNTAPHLRRAASTDEGGRGLFLVAQLTQSWGTRYTPEGKVIWAECAVDAA
ncbi:SpoIIE family protein phosphatase [Streptomyces cavernae]|uniref:SpoIIE family protein phosphatase n=1 Tax=Streptomyces cavernae TaxID=2259034 RepID=UPI000FEB6F20|nr:SpoIIE family protein phosphatase [Streptomyces cavernae]